MLISKTIDKFTPKIIYKEIPIWRIKEVVQLREVEKPTIKEVIKIQKEYIPTQVDIFKITQVDDDTYSIIINSDNMQGEMLVYTPDGKSVYFSKKRPKTFYGVDNSVASAAILAF